MVFFAIAGIALAAIIAATINIAASTNSARLTSAPPAYVAASIASTVIVLSPVILCLLWV
jgi:hypothetical protein